MKIEFHPEAEEEFVEQALYYEEQVTTLGTSFIGELESATTLLAEHPKLGPEFDQPFGHLSMRRFPHSLIYIIEPSRAEPSRAEPSRVWVVAVAHQRRRLGYWRGRIDR